MSFRLQPGADQAPFVRALQALPDVTVRSLQIEYDDQSDQWEVTAGVKTGISVDLDSLLNALAARTDVDRLTRDGS